MIQDELMRRAADGDREAMGALYRQWSRYTAKMLRHLGPWAEDAQQECWSRYLPVQLRRAHTLRSALFAAARDASREMGRALRRERASPDPDAVEAAVVDTRADELIEASDTVRRLRHATAATLRETGQPVKGWHGSGRYGLLRLVLSDGGWRTGEQLREVGCQRSVTVALIQAGIRYESKRVTKRIWLYRALEVQDA